MQVLTVAIGVAVVLLGLICWVGQSLAFLAPEIARRLGLVEPREDMDETFYIIEVESLGLTDLLLTWTLPLSAFLMLVGTSGWPWLALVGGGTYLYMATAIILRRLYLARHGKRIGRASDVKVAYAFGALSLVSAIVMIVLAVIALRAS